MEAGPVIVSQAVRAAAAQDLAVDGGTWGEIDVTSVQALALSRYLGRILDRSPGGVVFDQDQ